MRISIVNVVTQPAMKGSRAVTIKLFFKPAF